jgi:biotin carboxylase
MSASGTRARTLLVVSAARAAVPIVTEVRRLGVDVVVCDGASDAPAFRVADDGLVAAVDDPDAVVEAARAWASRTPIAGVLAAGVEVPCTVAAVADALGLVGPSLAAAAVCDDRLRVRRTLADAGVAVPWSAAVPDPAALGRLAKRRGGPLLVRPVERRVAGALALGPGGDAEGAFARAVLASPGGRVMAEEVLPGPLLVAHALIRRGSVRVVALGDRTPAAEASEPVGAAVSWPSTAHPSVEDRVEALLQAAVRALGLASGLLRATVAVGGAGPTLLSLGTGLAGGRVTTHAIPLATGLDVLDFAVRTACGDDVALPPRQRGTGRGAAIRAVFGAPGTVTAVLGAADAAAAEGVVAVDVGVTLGTRLGARDAAVVVVAVGPTADAARRRAESAAARIRVVTRAAASRTAPTARSAREC